ncbi:cysteine protease C88, partial [Heterobasidion irregulare TC 32-1]
QIVPDDNSCLFSSIAVVFEQDISKASTIRKIVADAIRNDPDTWSDAILGRPRADYISAILSPNTWGGAIELTILATHYATEIASVDVETGRVDRFTPLAGAGNRVLLIYSGIHYDAALLAPELGVPEEWCASIVPVGSDAADPNLSALKALAGKLRVKRQYTNTTTFDLKCEVCGKGLKGEKEARAHASETGHIKFGEY